ncbi:ABC transporter membrane-spanning protein [Catenulispora acidiphila DSM 44928]|uniref:ABC transporter membrane-spanning protein n=1 Tax=Catenulispora acidiphila (strain DSM 44928 / JCM 14897 / NBRC 102108 / NRRL B-24433 / ID139908) TaxID=479433 RepID=C7QC44_CATAD|nr:ABC transporter permease [Catenulispora acidiphila]ACU74492.1 ABC transporter membrane-spanning protein [Catenulispora acidiphila DSM 44928]
MSAETASEPKKSDKKASTKTSKFATEPGAQADSDSGLRTLIKLASHRDRIMLPVWIYALLATVGGTAYSLKKLYPAQSDRDKLGASIGTNPSLRALYGPLYDTHSLGALTAWRTLGFGGLLIGIMVVLLITRHTRAEEESGRLELLGSGAVGRNAPLSAALSIAVGVCFGIGLLTAVVMVALGQGAGGALAFGACLFAVGVAFAGTQAVAVQLTETGRAANGIGALVLGVAYLLRTVGDAAGNSGGAGWVAWLSPFGWIERVHPWAGNRWWVLGVTLAAGVVAAAVGYRVQNARDLGSGLLPQRPGPASAGPGLRGVFGLGRCLQQPTLLGWMAGIFVFGIVMGSIAKGIDQLLNDNQQVEKIIGRYGGVQGLTDSYLATAVSFLGMAAAFYAVQAVLRLRGEETSGRAEPVLSGSAGRLAWAGSHLVFPAVGSALVMAAGGLGVGVGAGAVLGDFWGWVGRMVRAGLITTPALWIIAAVAVALFGLMPKWTAGAYGVFGVLVFIAYLGPLVNAGQWFLDLTPFTHIPKVPGGVFHWTPLVWMTAVAAVLSAVGLVGFRRRDVSSA